MACAAWQCLVFVFHSRQYSSAVRMSLSAMCRTWQQGVQAGREADSRVINRPSHSSVALTPYEVHRACLLLKM
jgi:hypothetical protein